MAQSKQKKINKKNSTPCEVPENLFQVAHFLLQRKDGKIVTYGK